MGTNAASAPQRPSRRYGYYALALLAGINFLSYINRSVIFALFPAIERDLHLTDAHAGWLASSYVLVYSLAALPFGVVGDLRSRRVVIAAGVAAWSLFTCLGGLVQGFGGLFICRAAVGAGGAAAAAGAASMVADYFPDKRRALAMGIFMAAISLGGVLGIVVGAQLEAVYGWRLTFVAVGLPGFGAALLAGNLRDPSRIAISLALREFLQELELGVNSLIRRCLPIILATAFGSIAAYVLDKRFGASSALDTAAFALILGLGLAINIRLWVRQARAAPAHPASPATVVEAAAGEIVRGVRAVLRTPTLVYIFVGGALISFGMNGLVGWAPTFTSRELGLSVAEVSVRLGKWGLIFGIAGTLTGGWVADWLRKYTGAGRIITVALGFAIGGPLAVWLLTVRDIDTFGTVFCAAFFFLTWYNGPLTALIFDVVPSNIGGTVVGAYLLFIHLAGDTISFPLVGALSDRFGIDRAVFVLPVMATLGGLVVLGAIRTLTVDADRAHLATAEWEIRVIGRS